MEKNKAFAFDRDGTLEWGNPPGPVKKHHLIFLKQLGYQIGGSGGQAEGEQYSNWKSNGIDPDFVVFKSDIYTLKPRYSKIIHIGDDITDRKVANRHKLGYMKPDEFVKWIRARTAKYKSSGGNPLALI